MTRDQLLSPSRSRLLSSLAGLLALLAVMPLSAQQVVQSNQIFRQAYRTISGNGLELLSTNRAQALDVDMQAFRRFASSEMEIQGLPLAPGLNVDLELTEWNIIEPGAHLVYGTENGEVPIRLSTRFYRGKVKGDAESDVFLAFADNSFIGHVRTVDKDYELSTDLDVKNDGPFLPVVSYPTDVLSGSLGKCGVTEENLHELIGPNFQDYRQFLDEKGASLAADQINFAAVGAWEGDYEFLQLFGGDEQAAADYMAQVIGDVSSVYERDLGAQLTIGHMKIWTSTSAERYPYKETQIMSVALRETRDYWRTPEQDNIDRAFVHTMSGKGWVNPIGIAFLDVLCDKGRSGSFSAITRTNAARDRRVVAHEVGHNFGSPHTHNCGWPVPNGPGAIDQCAPAEGGSCFSGTTQEVGTIMSYCSQNRLEFHPLVQDLIEARLAQSGCISSARKLLIRPNLVIFGDEQQGVSRDTTISTFFENIGFGDIEVTEIKRAGENNDQFEILEMPEVPFTLEAGGTASIKVRFKAENTLPAEMILTFTHNGFNPAVEVTFEGYASDVRPILAFQNEEELVDWGERFQGTKNDSVLIGLFRNFGLDSQTKPAALYITDTRLEGPDKLDFQIIEGTAPLQLGGLEATDVGLRFAPATVGEKHAWLVVESNSGGVPGHLDSLELMGKSKIGPIMQLAIADLIIDFGDCERGTKCEQSFDNFFSNVGGEALEYSFVTEGPNWIFQEPGTNFDILLDPGESDPLVASVFTRDTVSLGLKRAKLLVLSYEAEQGLIQVSNDTIHMVVNITGPSSVAYDMEPDEFFYMTPNPATGAQVGFYLAPRAKEQGDLFLITVLDVNGREVYRRAGQFGIKGERWSVDAHDWASGVYYVRVSTENGVRARKVNLRK